MNLNTFTQILNSVAQLTHHQKRQLLHRVKTEISSGECYEQVDQCKGDDVNCPYCDSESVNK